MARSKLTEENKNEIRRLNKEGYTQASLAELFGVSKQTIYRVINPDYYAKNLQQSIVYQRENKDRIRQRRINTRKDYFLSFNSETDAAVISQLDKQENVQDYIRILVTDDIKKNSQSE